MTMTREKCKAILPIIEAFANGETVEFYDTDIDPVTWKRGYWRTADSIGFGARIESYRIVKKDGEIIYFGDRTKENINHDGLYKQKYEDLLAEFEQYKKESVKWGVDDFTEYDHPTHTITREQAQMALEYMIYKHDSTVGITWDTIEYYLADYGTPKKVDRFIVTDKSGRSAKPYEMTHDQVALIGAGESWQEELNGWLDDCESGDIFDQHNIKIQVL